jgi:phage internal scaffolding protein
MTRNLFEAVNGVVSFGSAYVQHDPVDLDFPDDGMTKQEFAEECDINSLMARYQKTGMLPGSDRRPMYGDFSNLPDFMEAQEILRSANEAFMALPAVVRRQFDNDPALFVAFAEDEKNIDQLRLWGLAEPLVAPEAPEPALEPAIAPATPPASPVAS